MGPEEYVQRSWGCSIPGICRISEVSESDRGDGARDMLQSTVLVITRLGVSC